MRPLLILLVWGSLVSPLAGRSPATRPATNTQCTQ